MQIDYDKLTLADEYIKDTKGDATVDLQTESTNFIFLLYTNTGDKELGLLDKDTLKAIRKIEQDYLNDEEYQKFCLAIKPLEAGDAPTCDESMIFSCLDSILGPAGVPGSLDLETAT